MPSKFKPDIVLDTGALVELENRNSNLFKELKAAVQKDSKIIVLTPVLVEWKAGRPTLNINRILDLVKIVELTKSVAELAAKGLQGVGHIPCKYCGVRGGPSVIDAVVMAYADQNSYEVYTGDVNDFELLGRHFRRAVVKHW
jgi:hypothetical protein